MLARNLSYNNIGQQVKYKGEWLDIMDVNVRSKMTSITLSNAVVFSVASDAEVKIR